MWFGQKGAPHVTRHKEVHFDQGLARIKPLPGEDIVYEVNEVEDTKAGKLEKGKLLLTVLRVVWISDSSPSLINLSIGLQTIQRIDTITRARSDVPPLHLLTTSKTSKFEFIFTPKTASESRAVLQRMQLLHEHFNATSRFREVRMRANLTECKHETDLKELLLLEGEQIHEQLSGVMNLSKDHGQLGIFWVTDLRVVWVAQLQTQYNCSIPYVQVSAVRQQKTRFGTVLVVETFPQPQKYLLGFQIQPKDKLTQIQQLIDAMLQMSRTKPCYGVRAEDVAESQGVGAVAGALFEQECATPW